MQQVRNQLTPEEIEPLSAWERRGSSFIRGRREGREEGRAVAMREAIAVVLAARGSALDAESRAQLATIDDLDQLRELVEYASRLSEGQSLFEWKL